MIRELKIAYQTAGRYWVHAWQTHPTVVVYRDYFASRKAHRELAEAIDSMSRELTDSIDAMAKHDAQAIDLDELEHDQPVGGAA